jgi:transcription initiation factor TFIIIB Brf1 subunit/transcription initiation factor TFIIB
MLPSVQDEPPPIVLLLRLPWRDFGDSALCFDGRSSVVVVEGVQDATWPSCAHCGDAGPRILDGNVVCTGCQTVVSRWVDARAEWRNFSAESGGGAFSGRSNMTRCGPPSGGGGGGVAGGAGSNVAPMLGCFIPRWAPPKSAAALARGTGSGGNAGEMGHMIHKLQMWNSITHRQRVMLNVFESLTLDAAQHGLAPCILEDAKALYRRMADAIDAKGEHRPAMMGASIYLSCKRNGVPRTMREVSLICNLRLAALHKGYRLFQDAIESDATSSCSADFVGRFCSRLDMDPRLTARVRTWVDRFTAMGAEDVCTPPTLVAGVIRYVCEKDWAIANAVADTTHAAKGNADAAKKPPITRQQIGDACRLSAATVGKSYQIMCRFVDGRTD